MNISDNSDAMEVVVEPEVSNNSGNRLILASIGSVSSIEVQLHPLVILTISDHWTRRKAQEGKEEFSNFHFFKHLCLDFR